MYFIYQTLFLLDIWNKCKGKLKQDMVPLSIVKLLFRVNREKIYDIDVILKNITYKSHIMSISKQLQLSIRELCICEGFTYLCNKFLYLFSNCILQIYLR